MLDWLQLQLQPGTGLLAESAGQLDVWTSTQGLQVRQRDGSVGAVQLDTQQLGAALQRVLSQPDGVGRIIVACDPFAHLVQAPGETPTAARLTTARLLREAAHQLRSSNKVLLLLGPQPALPADSVREIPVIEFPLPNEAEIRHILVALWKDWNENKGKTPWDEQMVEPIVRACQGLTALEIEDAIALAMQQHQGLTRECVGAIHRVKQLAVNRASSLEAIPVTTGVADVGGLDVLKHWVSQRQQAFSDKAKRFGVEPPKGLLTVGVPGGGKGLSARAVASAWGLPLIRLDWGALMGKWLGDSEGNLRSALRIAEATSPCVLWVDEIEKAMGQGGGDNGTATRVFGAFLTWMQERKAPVVCYFTANDISAVPPELMRKGRLDEIFFIDLPSQAEREAILAIHLRKRGRDPNKFPLQRLAKACAGFVGAEIEQGIQEAIVTAFAADADDITPAHIELAFGRTLPLMKTQPERLQRMRALVEEGRAVRASTPTEEHEQFAAQLAAATAPREGMQGLNLVEQLLHQQSRSAGGR